MDALLEVLVERADPVTWLLLVIFIARQTRKLQQLELLAGVLVKWRKLFLQRKVAAERKYLETHVKSWGGEALAEEEARLRGLEAELAELEHAAPAEASS